MSTTHDSPTEQPDTDEIAGDERIQQDRTTYNPAPISDRARRPMTRSG